VRDPSSASLCRIVRPSSPIAPMDMIVYTPRSLDTDDSRSYVHLDCATVSFLSMPTFSRGPQKIVVCAAQRLERLSAY